MKLSIITINYNNLSGIKNTIESVRNQHLTDCEYIIIDGGSTDGSVDIIKQNSDIIKYWISEPDKGIYDAMNKGIIAAKGKYLQFLNSGDIFFNNDTTKTELNYIDINPDVDIFYGNFVLINRGEGHDPFKVTLGKTVDVTFFRNGTINHQAALIRAALFKDNLYDTSYKAAGDYVKFLEFALNGRRYFHIEQPLVGYDFNGLSTTDDGVKLYRLESSNYWDSKIPAGLDKILEHYIEMRSDMNHSLVKRSIKFSHLITELDDSRSKIWRNIKSKIKRIIKA